MLAQINENGEKASPPQEFLMPAKATPIKVIGLAEVLEGMELPIEVSSLAHRFHQQTPSLLSTLGTAEGLGLVKKEGKYVILTDLGLGFLKASDGKISIIRAELRKIEPFKTALELLLKKSSVSAWEVAESLHHKNMFWQQSPEKDEAIVKLLLIEWGIAAELLSYNGKSQQFQIM